MVVFDQPEILEPDVDESNDGADTGAPETGVSAPDGGDQDDSEGDQRASGSGFVPIAIGLAALLPLPSLIQRRC
jgi:hypothetical protein